MTDSLVEKYWPQIPALEAALQRLSEGRTVPIRLRPNADHVTVEKNFMSALRAQMYLTSQL